MLKGARLRHLLRFRSRRHAGWGMLSPPQGPLLGWAALMEQQLGEQPRLMSYGWGDIGTISSQPPTFTMCALTTDVR